MNGLRIVLVQCTGTTIHQEKVARAAAGFAAAVRNMGTSRQNQSPVEVRVELYTGSGTGGGTAGAAAFASLMHPSSHYEISLRAMAAGISGGALDRSFVVSDNARRSYVTLQGHREMVAQAGYSAIITGLCGDCSLLAEVRLPRPIPFTLP